MDEKLLPSQALLELEQATSPEEARLVLEWLQEFRAIVDSARTTTNKRQAVEEFLWRRNEISLACKSVMSRLKKTTWTDRTITERFAIWSLLALPAAFTGQGVGIATGGWAIGMRLWFFLWIFGTGVSGIVESHFLAKRNRTAYFEIEAEKIENGRG